MSTTANTELLNSVGSFAELVAAGTPTPGGGSVAAHCGMLASALGQMVCSLTIGKKKYAEVEQRVSEIKGELERLGARLRELIAEDAASFDKVMTAFRLPKETDEQKAERDNQINLAAREAISVPRETAHTSFEVLKLLKELGSIGNQTAFSDLAVGSQLARTAIRGAFYNVGVNLSMLSGREEADELRQQMTGLLNETDSLAGEIESEMMSKF